MKITSLKTQTIKLFIFAGALAYIGSDLFIWHGPIWNYLHKEKEEVISDGSPVLAVVYGEQITEAQLMRRLAEHNSLSGRDAADTTMRRAILRTLVKEALLRMRTRYNNSSLPDCDEEAAAICAALESREHKPELFTHQLASQGYTRESFTDKIRAIQRQRIHLERATDAASAVTDEDIAALYEMEKGRLVHPAQRPVSHIFLTTNRKDANQVEQQARQLLDKLEKGEDFTTLAGQHSDDSRTAALGGNLGAMQDTPARSLPELPLFDTFAVPAGTPVLHRSQWGWHIILAGEITPARQMSLDECRDSLRSAIAAARRITATEQYENQDYRESLKQNHIQLNEK